MSDAAKEKAAEIGAELIGKLVELGGRGLEGLFSSPWTGVPFALIILSNIDPSGKLTIAFLNNLRTFIEGLAKAFADALVPVVQQIGKGVGVTPITTITTGTGQFCYSWKVTGWLRILPLVSIVPAGQACFLSRDERDLALQKFKDALGAGAGLYDFNTTDGP